MTKELQSVRSKIIKAVFKEDFQILGRKIGLEDVLRAMKKKKNRVFTDQIHLIAGALEDTQWQLGKSLAEQSQSTLHFFDKILELK